MFPFRRGVKRSRGPAQTPPPLQFRPVLEALEDRALPSVNTLASLPAPWAQTFHGDFNGDARQDVAGFTDSGQWWVSLSTGTAFAARTLWDSWSVPPSWARLFVADVNGDGRDDIVGFGQNGTWWAGLSNGATGFQTSGAWAFWSLPASWSQLFVADFNGDDRDDIAGLGFNGQWFVGLSNGAGVFATGASPWAQWSIPASWAQLFVADVNADGRDDIVGFGFTVPLTGQPPQNGAWWVGHSDGTGTFGNGGLWAFWSTPATWSQLFVADFTGDGTADAAGFAPFSGLGTAGPPAWNVGVSNALGEFPGTRIGFLAGGRWVSW